MIFILGGKYQGKTAYARHAYGQTKVVFDFARQAVAAQDSVPHESETENNLSMKVHEQEIIGNRKQIDYECMLQSAEIITNLQEGVRQLIDQGICPQTFFRNNMDKLKDKVIIGTEIGCGIVPVEEKDRYWRDETGRVYQLLAEHAEKVERVWAGIPMTIKNNQLV